MTDGLGIAVALLATGAAGLVVAIARYGRAAARYRRYERELARNAELNAAAHDAAAHYYVATGPRDNKAAAP
jgi:biopolymer transport protein ExbB/TolQ